MLNVNQFTVLCKTFDLAIILLQALDYKSYFKLILKLENDTEFDDLLNIFNEVRLIAKLKNQNFDYPLDSTILTNIFLKKFKKILLLFSITLNSPNVKNQTSLILSKISYGNFAQQNFQYKTQKKNEENVYILVIYENMLLHIKNQYFGKFFLIYSLVLFYEGMYYLKIYQNLKIN